MTLCTYNITEQGNRVEMEYELVPLTVGQELVLPSGFIARPFTTVHTVASQVGIWGFSVCHRTAGEKRCCIGIGQ